MPQRSFLPEQKNVLEINKQGYISEVSSSTVRCYEKDRPDHVVTVSKGLPVEPTSEERFEE